MQFASKSPDRPPSAEAISAEIDRLAGLPLKGLRDTWRAEFKKAPPVGLWRDFLVRVLAWRLQEKAFGGHDRATERLLSAYGRGGKVPKAARGNLNQRLKTGTVLVRDFRGVRHAVTLVPEGYIWQENTYSSLSAIAKLITGTNWNGPRFFGVREAGRKAADKPEIEVSTPLDVGSRPAAPGGGMSRSL